MPKALLCKGTNAAIETVPDTIETRLHYAAFPG
jgi:hypothetical protein